MSPLVQVCCALAQIAKHSVDLAEVVVEAEVFPKILTCLKFPDELVRKHTATVVREVSGMQPPWWPPVSMMAPGVLQLKSPFHAAPRHGRLGSKTHMCFDWNFPQALCNGALEMACQPDS